MRTSTGAGRRLTTRLTTAASSLVLLVGSVALTGCTAGEADTPTPGERDADAAALVVSAPVTKVAGRLGDPARLAVRREVEGLIGDWLTAAFLAPEVRPRSAAAFPGFTPGAVRLAQRRAVVLSRAGLGDTEVRPVRAEATVNVLAPGGEPAGATANLDVVLATGGERVRLQGRLLLTRADRGWRVFGFDVRRSER